MPLSRATKRSPLRNLPMLLTALVIIGIFANEFRASRPSSSMVAKSATEDTTAELMKNQSQRQGQSRKKVASPGPSLDISLKFIRDTVNRIGPISYVTYSHDAITGQDWAIQHKEDDSSVAANPAACMVSYHYQEVRAGKVVQDEDAWIPLNHIESVSVIQEERFLKEIDSANGHPSWSSRVDPELFVLKATRFNSHVYNALVFSNEASANRVAKAMLRAVELCGGGKQNIP